MKKEGQKGKGVLCKYYDGYNYEECNRFCFAFF